jgi:hypothetical protein
LFHGTLLAAGRPKSRPSGVFVFAFFFCLPCVKEGGFAKGKLGGIVFRRKDKLTILQSAALTASFAQGSHHSIHKNRGRVPRFLYFEREKVSHWELSDVLCSAAPEHLVEKPLLFDSLKKFLPELFPKGAAERPLSC